MLALKVQETQAEAKLEVEKERSERMRAIAQIESINQTLIASQKEAELKLSSEKEELRMVLRAMESEKVRTYSLTYLLTHLLTYSFRKSYFVVFKRLRNAQHKTRVHSPSNTRSTSSC